MSDIFREIDEELRRDNLLKLWQRYGTWIVAVAVLAIALTAAAVGWRAWQQHQHEAEGTQYAAALDAAAGGQNEKALEALRRLAQEGDHGYALLARFGAAALQGKSGDEAGAIASYKAIAGDDSVDAGYRNLATVLWALHALPKEDPQTLIATLKPLAEGDGSWRASARELTALAELRAGNTSRARELYKGLADDLAAPPALRARAAEMVSALGS